MSCNVAVCYETCSSSVYIFLRLAASSAVRSGGWTLTWTLFALVDVCVYIAGLVATGPFDSSRTLSVDWQARKAGHVTMEVAACVERKSKYAESM